MNDWSLRWWSERGKKEVEERQQTWAFCSTGGKPTEGSLKVKEKEQLRRR